MALLGEIFRSIHVVFGAIGLIAFWVPIFARKGAVNHVRFGKVFVWSAYAVLAAAAVALTIRWFGLLAAGEGPAERPDLYAFMVFLAYLTFVTFVIVRHGMQVLQHKAVPTALYTPFNKLLAWGAIIASTLVVLYGVLLNPANKILLFALSPIGFGNGYGILQYIKGARPSKREWLYSHLGAMLGAGIAFHTAFAVFGSTRLFDIGFSGWAALIPWVAPTVIGIPAIVIWTRYYQRKFNDLP